MSGLAMVKPPTLNDRRRTKRAASRTFYLLVQLLSIINKSFDSIDSTRNGSG